MPVEACGADRTVYPDPLTIRATKVSEPVAKTLDSEVYIMLQAPKPQAGATCGIVCVTFVNVVHNTSGVCVVLHRQPALVSPDATHAILAQ